VGATHRSGSGGSAGFELLRTVKIE